MGETGPSATSSNAHARLRERAQSWIAQDPDPRTRQELRDLLSRMPGSVHELATRFAGRLRFGTAGLRGPLRAGPNGMNRAVVRAATSGLMSYLDHAGVNGPIVIGYDARHGSAAFAQETQRVATGVGRRALTFPRPLPTPLLAYAVRHMGAAAGVMVTASHNRREDNGYKVYLSDGAQIAPPIDAEIEAAIDAVSLPSVSPGGPGEQLAESLVTSYVDSVTDLLQPGSPRNLTIAYTPLHGVGADVFNRVFRVAGFTQVHMVPEQSEPDPNFPTAPFPNPEEPGTLDLAMELATRIDADLVLANDPDADRCAVAVPDDKSVHQWRRLTGDEVGVLLADHLMRHGAAGTYASTIVSSSMLGAMCRQRGLEYVETLTGFKWLARSAPDLVFAYEEALGYAVAPQLVRDKDGISAALLIAELVAELKAIGRTLQDRLDELAREFGVYATEQISVRVNNVSEIDAAMRRLRSHLPSELLDRPVTDVRDLLPESDVVILRADGLRVVVRPSGTEPKLKIYLEAVDDSARGC